jgi:excisionase family DNA binding protein
MHEPDLDIIETAAAVPCHYTTVLRAIRSGRLRAVKRLGKWRIERSELARFLASISQPAEEPEEVRVREALARLRARAEETG